MADGFIVRRGGKGAEQAATPTITEVSKTDTQIVFTITNNDASTAVILWEVDDSSPDANSLELASAATSSNITVTGLDDDTTFIVYATANVAGKIKSEVASESITTDLTVVYTAATGGTTNDYDSSGKRFRSHTFTSNGTFTVTTVGDNIDDRNKVDYLIIAGGGAGGGDGQGGGGGAGGYRTTVGTSGADSSAESKVTVTAQGYSITIGAGGAIAEPNGNPGVASSALGVSTVGGGGGGGFGTNGGTGGSGGGGGGSQSSAGSGGTGTALEGRNGGNGALGTGNNPRSGGGGGGASNAGANASAGTAGNGGDGLANLLRTGSNETRAGGGGGGKRFIEGTDGTGGAGGGGNGGSSATANTGGGGGGGNLGENDTAGAGGSGIVVIRYEIAPTV
jgi:hypothetical protein